MGTRESPSKPEPTSAAPWNSGLSIRVRNRLRSHAHALRSRFLWMALADSGAMRAVLVLIRNVSGSRFDLRKVTLGWIGDAVGYRVEQLRGACDVTSVAPRSTGESRRFADGRREAIHLLHFRNATITSSSSSVFVDGTLLVDGMIDAAGDRLDYSQGQLKRHRNHSAIIRHREPVPLPAGIFMAGNGSANYYHWLVEILPRAEFLDHERLRACPILVDECVRGIPSFRQMLEVYAPGRDVVTLDPSRHYAVKSLYYIETPNQLPYNLNMGHSSQASDACIDPRAIQFLRHRAQGLARPASHARERVLLARKGLRRNYNQAEIERFLERYGFHAVFMEDLSFAEQVALMQQASAVIGPTGAAWANLVFARPGLKCICWMAEENGDFPAFSTIANITGADLRYVRYHSGADSSLDLYSKGYRLPPGILAAALQELGITPA